MAHEHREYSEETAARIDRDVQRLLEEGHARSLAILTAARKRLEALAQELLSAETVGPETLERVLGARDPGCSVIHAA